MISCHRRCRDFSRQMWMFLFNHSLFMRATFSSETKGRWEQSFDIESMFTPLDIPHHILWDDVWTYSISGADKVSHCFNESVCFSGCMDSLCPQMCLPEGGRGVQKTPNVAMHTIVCLFRPILVTCFMAADNSSWLLMKCNHVRVGSGPHSFGSV